MRSCEHRTSVASLGIRDIYKKSDEPGYRVLEHSHQIVQPASLLYNRNKID